MTATTEAPTLAATGGSRFVGIGAAALASGLVARAVLKDHRR